MRGWIVHSRGGQPDAAKQRQESWERKGEWPIDSGSVMVERGDGDSQERAASGEDCRALKTCFGQ